MGVPLLATLLWQQRYGRSINGHRGQHVEAVAEGPWLEAGVVRLPYGPTR